MGRSVRSVRIRYAQFVTSPEDSVAALSFVCPRCANEVLERLYGPCSSCRDELQAMQKIDARDVKVGPYESKMNVTPNFVATKE